MGTTLCTGYKDMCCVPSNLLTAYNVLCQAACEGCFVLSIQPMLVLFNHHDSKYVVPGTKNMYKLYLFVVLYTWVNAGRIKFACLISCSKDNK